MCKGPFMKKKNQKIDQLEIELEDVKGERDELQSKLHQIYKMIEREFDDE
jgi:predicted RNase H-like nuclease (RuvC/YqgF family)